MPKILVVDDESEVLEFMQRFLARRGLQTIGVQAGRRAFSVYKQERPDLVFLDITMPDADGVTILKKIKEFDFQAQVIMLTSKTSQQARKEAERIGALDYLTKPIELSQIDAIIRRLFASLG